MNIRDLLDEYQNTVIRFPKESSRHGEYESVEVGIDRSYQPSGLGNGNHTKTGPWVVLLKNGSCLSSSCIPADAARRVASAICTHAAECDRRNKAGSEPVLVNNEDDDFDGDRRGGMDDK